MGDPRRSLSLAVATLIIVPAAARAQSVTVFGGSADARLCSETAQMAAKREGLESGSRGDLKPCNRALERGDLDSRDLAAIYINRGILYKSLERYEEALADYGRAKELKADFPEIYLNQGNVFFRSGDLDRAVEEYSRALELDISVAHVVRVNRGMAHEKLGDLDRAEADYRRAIELAPEWPLARRKLDQLLSRRYPS